jgi:hypothetical protein
MTPPSEDDDPYSLLARVLAIQHLLIEKGILEATEIASEIARMRRLLAENAGIDLEQWWNEQSAEDEED